MNISIKKNKVQVVFSAEYLVFQLMMNFAPKLMKYKVIVTQKLRDELIFEFLCLHSVLFWIALHLFYLILFCAWILVS